MSKIFLFVIPILFQQLAFAQETFSENFKYRATYEITYQIDSTDINSVASEEMVLYLGDRISRFSSRERLRGDSILQNRKKNPDQFRGNFAGAPQTKFDYYVYKGIPEGKLSYTRKVVKDNFRYQEDADQFQWEILPETKEIAGYQVQQAATRFAGRDYIAWFTPEIPIPDGPYKFSGLPGLILEIKDTKGHYAFILTKFESFKEPVPLEFETSEYILTTKEKLEKALEAYNRDPFAALERVGVTIGFKPGQKERMEKQRKEELKKENNPIELE